jgi:hypothetical protein
MNTIPSIQPWMIMFPLAGLAIFCLVVTIKFCGEDARRRGKSPVWVTLAAVVFFPWGLIAWLLFRPEPLDGGDLPPFRLEDHRRQ